MHLTVIFLGASRIQTSLLYTPCAGDPFDLGKQLVTVDQPQLHTHNSRLSVLIMLLLFLKLPCSNPERTAPHSNAHLTSPTPLLSVVLP